MAEQEELVVQEQDIYEKSAFYRYLALIAGLLAWTFDGVEQGVYTIITRAALKDIVPGIPELVEKLNELNKKINALESQGISVTELQQQAAEITSQIDTPVAFYFSLALAMWLFGAAAGGILFGRLGDRIGRVKALMLAVITYSAFTGLSALSLHWTHLAAYRFLGALGLGGAWPLSVALIVETWEEKHRPVLAGLMGAGANVGYLIAASYSRIMLSYGFNWRWVIGMGCVIGFSSLFVIWFVPESPKWKRSREKKQRSSIRDLFSRRYRRSTIIGTLLATVALLGTWGSFLWFATYVDQISEGTKYADTAKAIVSQWQSYGQIIGGFMGGVLAGWLGNKTSYRFLCITAWASVLALFGLNDQFGWQMLWMGAFAGLFVTAYFGWLPKFLPELFPTRIRATGQGFTYNFGRVFAGIGVLGTGSLAAAFGGNYKYGAMTMATIYLLGLIVIQFAPDTGGKMISDEEDAAMQE